MSRLIPTKIHQKQAVYELNGFFIDFINITCYL